MTQTRSSVPKLVAMYALLALLVPASVMIGVAIPNVIDGLRSGLCAPVAPAVVGEACGLGGLLTEALFGPTTLTLTLAMGTAWAIALAMAMGIFLTMKRLFASEESSRIVD